MKHKTIVSFILLAILSAAVFLLIPESSGSIWLLFTRPIILFADGLRSLSLSGGRGNIVAVMLYVSFCLLPLSPLLTKKRSWEDVLLLLGSGVLFYVLYLLINPGLMPQGIAGDVGSVILCGTVWSIFITWGVLRLLRQEHSVEQKSGYQLLKILLRACAVLYVLAGFGVGAGTLKTDILAVMESNTMPGLNLADTYVFLFLIFAVQAMEYALDAWLMLWGVELVKALEADPYSEKTVTIAWSLSKLARVSLMVTLLSNMALNIAQMLDASRLHIIDGTIRIPVFSVALCLGCMALTRLLGQGRELKKENDLYI